MKMQIRFKGLLMLLSLALAIAWGGCRFRPQVPESPAQPEAPPLPEALAEFEGREPRLRVFFHETGAVREMAFEDYIAGVVAAEMDPQWHEDALAAQAIIARSFTLQKIKDKGGVPERKAHASTDIEEFQAYDAARINDRVRRAVEKTRGQVVVHDGDYIRGWFHAFAGPRTARADEGLEFEGGNPPYIQIVDSPGEDIIPAEERYWSASFSLSQVREAVSELAGRDPGPVEKVTVSARGPSGRATKISVNGVAVSAPSLRLALDSTAMRSTFIEEVELGNGEVHFSGSGYGHGVGMCQWGARALAEEGWSCNDIVAYFYRNVDVVRVWD
jgi:stage II sporulation protein D